MVAPEDGALVLTEGIAKGGYPVDIAAQSTVDLTSIGQSELGCASTLIESGLEPMEMAELVDILPTLSLIEEETPSGLPTPLVMDMLESFGLGINENNTLFHIENSNLTNGAGCLSEPDANYNSSSSRVSELQGQDTSACPATVNAAGGDVPDLQVHGKEKCFPVRNQVEWERPANNSS